VAGQSRQGSPSAAYNDAEYMRDKEEGEEGGGGSIYIYIFFECQLFSMRFYG
jgi:hypothetical protein